MKLDRSLLGSNPLAGVDHLSSDRARGRGGAREEGQDLTPAVINAALSAGANGITYTLGDSVDREIVSASPKTVNAPAGLYPLIPDVDVVPRVLNRGLIATALEFTKGLSLSMKTRAFLRGGISYITSSPFTALKSYFEIEVDRIERRKPDWAILRTLILHELATDAIVGLRASNVFGEYCDVFKSATNLPPAFETRNLVGFVHLCKEACVDIKEIVTMTPFNSLGFQMAPSGPACKEAFHSVPGANVIAISILAGGRISIANALQFLGGFPSIKSVAVGVSSIAHATETFGKLRTYWAAND